MNEMTAGQRLAKKFSSKCVLKLVKMQEMPQPREIMKQLNVIHQQWDHFAYESRDFNMKLERKQPRLP